MTNGKLSAVLLDRDGVINRELGRAVRVWEEFEFLPGVLHALRQLAGLPVPILVLSNQSAVGRGWVPLETVDGIHRRMSDAIREAGGRIDDVMICPHAPEAQCLCRKPLPGLLFRAAQDHGFDLRHALMIGDSYRDVQAAQRAGAIPVMVRSGHPIPPDLEGRLCREAVQVVADLRTLADALVNKMAAVGGEKATIG